MADQDLQTNPNRSQQMKQLESFFNRPDLDPADRAYALRIVRQIEEQSYPVPVTARILSEHPLQALLSWIFTWGRVRVWIRNQTVVVTTIRNDGTEVVHENIGIKGDFRIPMALALSHTDLLD